MKFPWECWTLTVCLSLILLTRKTTSRHIRQVLRLQPFTDVGATPANISSDSSLPKYSTATDGSLIDKNSTERTKRDCNNCGNCNNDCCDCCCNKKKDTQPMIIVTMTAAAATKTKTRHVEVDDDDDDSEEYRRRQKIQKQRYSTRNKLEIGDKCKRNSQCPRHSTCKKLEENDEKTCECKRGLAHRKPGTETLYCRK